MSKAFTEQDLIAIKDWLSKETYLPQDFDDLTLSKFLHSCYGSLERTKQCIQRFCSTRASMPEIYTNRCPFSQKMTTAFNITNVGTYEAGENEILLHQLDDPTLENFVFYDVLKSFALQADYWIKVHPFFAEGHIIVLDMKDLTWKILPKVNIMFFRDFILYLLEGMPVRVKQVHVINAPPYYEKLYALVKPVLPAEICDIIKFHATTEGLHMHVDKKYLPKNYGGDAEDLHSQHTDWVKKIREEKELKNDDMWKANLKKKPNSVDTAMSGSFRTLSID